MLDMQYQRYLFHLQQMKKLKSYFYKWVKKWRLNFGSSAIDYIKNKNYEYKKEIETKLKFKLKTKIVVFTFHPTIIDYRNLENQIKIILKSLIFIANKKIQIIITFPNSDFGSIRIIKHLKKIKHKIFLLLNR